MAYLIGFLMYHRLFDRQLWEWDSLRRWEREGEPTFIEFHMKSYQCFHEEAWTTRLRLSRMSCHLFWSAVNKMRNLILAFVWSFLRTMRRRTHRPAFYKIDIFSLVVASIYKWDKTIFTSIYFRDGIWRVRVMRYPVAAIRLGAYQPRRSLPLIYIRCQFRLQFLNPLLEI